MQNVGYLVRADSAWLMCLSVVFAYQQGKTETTEKIYIFRTYKNLHRGEDKLMDRNPGLAQDVPIWQVARATSAAPTYFAPLKIGELEYLDGGFGATNNPCQEIYDEVRRMNNNSENCVKVVFSVGTGKSNKSRFNGTGITRYWNYINFAKKWASESETAHQNMLKIKNRITSDHHRFHYYRLNAETGLDDMKLDEWRVRGALQTKTGEFIGRVRTSLSKTSSKTGKHVCAQNKEAGVTEKDDTLLSTTVQSQDLRIPKWFRPKNRTLDSIRTHTQEYLGQDNVKQWIEECAKILVDGRRLRVQKNLQRWEKACFGAWFQCNIDGCRRAEKEYDDYHAIDKHFRDKHRTEFPRTTKEEMDKLEEALNKCKIVVH